ncbi:ABC transporter permease [Tritonibacter mobilis]|uniref:ABC transporter permease n=1 Tax=Tritonibacter mobilis TaxID=379347 RepID=UPI001CD9B48C|nr:iron ABC transporter permease [Tritonibacter mobilis]MCA2009333.1 iron ABC transporter permease [Tritonibacter mobilis]
MAFLSRTGPHHGTASPPPFDRARLIQWLIFLVTASLMLAPALPILLQVVVDRPLYAEDWQFTLGNIAQIFQSERIGRIALTTGLFALFSVIIAEVLGIAAALLIGRTDMPGRKVMGDVLMWPLYLSHLIFALGWVIIYGPSGFVTQLIAQSTGEAPWNLYSIAGMSVVAGISQAPLAYLYCLYGAVRSVDSTLESAARTTGAGPLQVLRKVTLPLMIPSIITSTALNLVIAVETLSIPLFLARPARIDTLSTFLYAEGIAASNPNHGLVAASSLLLMTLVGSTLMLQRMLLRHGHRYETVKGKGSRPMVLGLGKLRWPLAILFATVLITTVVVPIAGIILRAFTSFLSPLVPVSKVLTLNNFDKLFADEANIRAIWNTVEIALLSAGLGTLLAVAVALVIQRSDFRFAGTLEALAYSPRVVPGMITGLGVFYAAVILPPMGWLRGNIGIIVVAYVMATLPLAMGVIQPAIVQIGRDLDRAARTVGADWSDAMRLILLPLLKPALLGSFILLFVFHLKSYIIAIFLMAPGLEVMGVSMLSLWTNGDVGVLAAFATFQIVLVATLLLLARFLFKVKIYD